MTNDRQSKPESSKDRRPAESAGAGSKARKSPRPEGLAPEQRLELARRAEAKRVRGKPPSI